MATAYESAHEQLAERERRIAEREAEFAKLSAQYVNQQESRYGVKPEIASLDTGDVQDEVPEDVERKVKSRPQERLFTLDEVEALIERRIDAVRASLVPVDQGGAPVFDGGEPVPHHIHLEDGRIITGHGGLGTHYSDKDGVFKIVAAYPVKKGEE